MTTQHPITPPPELVHQWKEDWHHSKVKHIELEPYITAQAAQWGADQELEACCAWIQCRDWTWTPVQLRASRRPKPPSLKEQAITELEKVDILWDTTEFSHETLRSLDTIRRALEALPD
jgi:hypothetical protein